MNRPRPIHLGADGKPAITAKEYRRFHDLHQDHEIRSTIIALVKSTPRWYKAGSYLYNVINKDTAISKRKLKNYFAYDYSTVFNRWMEEGCPGRMDSLYPTAQEVAFLIYALGLGVSYKLTNKVLPI